MTYLRNDIKVYLKNMITFLIILGVSFSISTPVYAQFQRENAAPRPNASIATPFLGDKSTKVYYPANCPGYANIPRDNRVRFQSAKQAEDAGYKLAPDCPR
jgi:hypothetical protein